MNEFYQIESEVLDIVLSELRATIQLLKSNKEISEFNVILDDLLENIETLVEMTQNYKLNTAMTLLRNAFELCVTYIAVVKNENIRKNYLDVTKKRNIKSCADVVSTSIYFDTYNEIYKFLCEFSHPTLLRNYYCDSNKTENGKSINRSIAIFIIILLLSEYNRYLNIIINKVEFITLDSLIILLWGAFMIFLKNISVDTNLKNKYTVLFYNQQLEENLLKQKNEFECYSAKNKDALVERLQATQQYNYELKNKIIEYIENDGKMSNSVLD